MYTGSYIPKFPYTGEQATLVGGRIVFHAKDDSAFIFANKAVVLSTSGSTHINSSEGVFINGNTIELGLNAQQPVIRGNALVDDLTLLCSALNSFSMAMTMLSESELEIAIPGIVKSAARLSETVNGIRKRLPNTLSKVTKTL